ncbi:hypothetical protein [uncultured Psychrobacter sp.]|uniref:hypothetical protein n=1 Tax=uncultured Psychrobacter sp. TaxID=259303 RepID=UPI00345A246B
MNLGSLKQLKPSILITALLASVMTMSACQQQEPEQSLEEDIAAEQEVVPMSAEPADAGDTPVVADDATLNEVENDTVATVNDGIMQFTYLCSPELRVEATYKDETNQVVLGTDKGTLTLTKTNEGANPEVFEVDTAMDGGTGFTQWRVAHEERETGLMRTANAGDSDPDTYECKRTQDS